jgi:hypothetical protein
MLFLSPNQLHLDATVLTITSTTIYRYTRPTRANASHSQRRPILAMLAAHPLERLAQSEAQAVKYPNKPCKPSGRDLEALLWVFNDTLQVSHHCVDDLEPCVHHPYTL